MKVLMVVPSFRMLGGVSNHYEGLASYWRIKVSHVFYGKRRHVSAILTLVPDLLTFITRLIFGRFDVVFVNPSLHRYQLLRDGFYLWIATQLGKKVVTFIHGWDHAVAEQIKQHPKWFCRTYGRSLMIYVLCSDFKRTLEALPMDVPVKLTTTKVRDSMLEGFDITIRQGRIRTLLFLARAEKEKGIEVVIKCFSLLKKRHHELNLVVCGTGTALHAMQQYVVEQGIRDVEFTGDVRGTMVVTRFREADIYLLPTTHGEGMPTSVLEAMAFGLPIISRPVGGLNDFFEEGRMGYLLESLQPEDYAERIEALLENPKLTRSMSEYNHQYACRNFLASSVTAHMEDDLHRLLANKKQ